MGANVQKRGRHWHHRAEGCIITLEAKVFHHLASSSPGEKMQCACRVASPESCTRPMFIPLAWPPRRCISSRLDKEEIRGENFTQFQA